MPLCRLVAAAAPWIAAHGQRLRRLHAGPGRMHLEAKNHYERLNLDPGASAGDVKRSFYLLSKRHHPDANPSDPQAASTFSLLSESYSVLSNPSRRASYDRDILRLSHNARPNPAASYHSTNPAGGRSPSGLSRRKTSFRGPPPSFFRSGGWGAHADKRRQAHDESTGASGPSRARPADHHDEHDYDDVPHFDREGHTRTHRREDDRRASRMMRKRRMARAVGDDDVEFEPQTSLTAHFFIVAAILAATFLVPAVYLQLMRLGKTGEDDDHQVHLHKKK